MHLESADNYNSMFEDVKNQINNCFFERNENAQKILAAHEEFTEAKIKVAEALNAELSARLCTVEASFAEACEEIVTLQEKLSKETKAGGCKGTIE